MDNRVPDSLGRSRGLGRAIRTSPDDGPAMRRKRLLRRLRRLNARKVIQRSLARRRKWRQLRRTVHPTTEKHPVFIVGCNRSGTNMVCGAIGRSPHGWAYHESEFSLAFNGYYLRADWIIEQLIRRTPATAVAFGCILDSQFTDQLLARFDGARAIWVYRRYEDVAASCSRMPWGYHLKNLVRWAAHGELEKLGARGRRIGTDTVQLFDELFREDLSDENCACLYWYMRNRLYFDLDLQADPRVLLVQYEDTVLNRERALRRISAHLDLPYDPALIEGIYGSSVGRYEPPTIDAGIREVCDLLRSRLDAHYASTSEWALQEDGHLRADLREMQGSTPGG